MRKGRKPRGRVEVPREQWNNFPLEDLVFTLDFIPPSENQLETLDNPPSGPELLELCGSLSDHEKYINKRLQRGGERCCDTGSEVPWTNCPVDSICPLFDWDTTKTDLNKSDDYWCTMADFIKVRAWRKRTEHERKKAKAAKGD